MSVLQNKVFRRSRRQRCWITNWILFVTTSCGGLHNARAQQYDPDVTKWEEIRPPPKTQSGGWIVWSSAANYSKIDWQLEKNRNRIVAHQTSNPIAQPTSRPNFVPKAEHFVGASAVQQVDDGWLVGFNQGEFGAALYWFSTDGRQKYKISDDQIVDFMSTPKRIIAIQGLAHLGISEGSLIAATRDSSTHHWRSTTIKKLEQAPYAFVRLSNGVLVIVLSDSLISLTPDDRVTTLIKSADWGGLYPNSIVLSADESKVYIGMRQFVAEFNLQEIKLRYLIPSRAFLNVLPKEDQARLRKIYKDGFANDPKS